jgi:SAM-dependent methyltransferase
MILNSTNYRFPVEGDKEATIFHYTENLNVFNSQYNVARYIFDKAIQKNILPAPSRKFCGINMMFLGPPSVMLRNQTYSDVCEFLDSIKAYPISRSDMESIFKNRVLNSSALKDYEKLSFVKDLSISNKIHVIIHDEAHFGVEEGSQLTKFYNFLLDLVDKMQPRPILLLLLVSATIEVITEVVPVECVKWKILREMHIPVTLEKPFVAPTYTAVGELNYIYDESPELINLTKLALKSHYIAGKYLEAFKMIELHFKKWMDSPVMEPLKFPSESDISYTILLRLVNNIESRSNFSYGTRQKNSMVFLRLDTVQSAIELSAALRNVISELTEFAKLRGFNSFDFFEIVNLSEERKTLSDQLSPTARSYLPVELQGSSDLMLKHFELFSTLVIAVDAAGMGVRLPPNCACFDLRAKYSSVKSKIQTTKTKFIQDIGRLAGHKRYEEMPSVYLSFRSEPDLNLEEEETYSKVHRLLNQQGLPMCSHPDFDNNSQVFSRLIPYAIALDAEPQIGKTGTFLSLLSILFSEFVNTNPKTVTDNLISRSLETAMDVDEPTSDENDFEVQFNKGFTSACRALRKIAQSDLQGADALMRKMADASIFTRFHAMLKEHHVDQPNDVNNVIIVHNIIEKILTSSESSGNVWRIADCGCGMHGVAPALNKALNSRKKGRNVFLQDTYHVYGFDLNRLIENCIEGHCHAKLKFFPCVQLMSTTDFPETDKFDFVIFNCSFFENDCTYHLHWAFRNLKTDGRLIIANIRQRFKTDWMNNLLFMGWLIPEDRDESTPHVFPIPPYLASVWQRPPGLNFEVPFCLTDVEYV